MKVLAILLLASYGLAHQAQSDYHQFKNWAQAKAMESCWGEENNKVYVVTMKKAVAKCRQQDAPELELPPYRSAYRFVNILTSSADNMEQNKMEQMYNMMKFFHHQQQDHNDRFTPYNTHRSSQDMMKKMMMKYKMEQMMEKFMNEDSYRSMKNQMSYSPEHKMDFGNFDTFGHKENKAKANFNFGMIRPARDAGDETNPIDLGDKLIAKINAQKEAMVAEIGNMTCVLKEMGMLNADNEIDVRSLKIKLNEYDLPSEWFKIKFEDLIDNCYEVANNLPKSINEQSIITGDFGTVNLGQVKKFMKCYKECHMKLCMDQDTKKNIESNYGPLEEILEQTGWTEYQLLTAFRQLITKEENEYL